MSVNLTKLLSYDIVSSPSFSGATFITNEDMERERKNKIRKNREKKLERLKNDFKDIDERSDK